MMLVHPKQRSGGISWLCGMGQQPGGLNQRFKSRLFRWIITLRHKITIGGEFAWLGC